ncbi:MAG TPA: phenylalanine--tRNA ligase subunit alpha [Thermomicrobiales bacterium]|nr:phenylalanine--tRNA ligase subunit alpha [Thermomicrobiales bacterium]
MTSTVTHGLTDEIDVIRSDAVAGLTRLASAADADAWESTYLGPKGVVTLLMRRLGVLPAEERPQAGRDAQQLRTELATAFAPAREKLAAAALESRLTADAIDVSLPGRQPAIGAIHPITAMTDELIEIFALLGFQAVFGPEVETGRYNFDMLNIPAEHPARDVWDTIHVQTNGEEIVMRTHTSPMQARTMERIDPPVRVVVPGRAFRFEAQDASHEWQFTQLEGLAVDRHITMANLKGTLQELARQLFGPERRIRFRCDFFPFVEPGVEFAVDCAICNGKGCRVCKRTGWLELGGAGMVHPRVLSKAGYDPNEVTGFAFGLGIDRLAMMKYGVDDVRAFAGNDIRFLRDFARVVGR